MRKQVDFDVRVFPLGNGANETMTHEAVGAFVRDNYLTKGWELYGNPSALQVSAGVIYYSLSFVRYEELGTVKTPPDASAPKVNAK